MNREQEINAAASKYIEDNSMADGYVAISDHKDSFIEGADWADSHPINHWIDVEDDLPCNHHSMICEVCKGVEYKTNSVLVLLIDGTIEISYMYHRTPYAWSWNTYKVTHWMPIPITPKEYKLIV